MQEQKNSYLMQIFLVIFPLGLVAIAWFGFHKLTWLDYVLLTFAIANIIILIITIVRNKKGSKK